MSRWIRIIILILCYSSAAAQEYYIKQYRVDEGLPSDIIKGCTQDQLGYFWIATDEGLVKYDGVNFISYREAMHSNYSKGFFNTRDGRLLAFGDLDLIEIKNLGDTVIFESLFPVNRIINDTSISYPKTIFEDLEGSLWISESQSVVKLRDQKIKRYEFGLTNRTPQFIRSFSFFEDRDENLYTCSFQGNVYRYDEEADQFVPTGKNFPSNVEFVLVVNNQILIGASDGLFVSELMETGGYSLPELKFKIPFLSYVTPLQHNHFFIATRGIDHYIAEWTGGSIEAIPISIANINHIYVSSENDILLSGNEGLIVIRKNIFQSVDENVTEFIESITEDDGRIYYATSTTLYEYNPETRVNKKVLEIPSGYFQSLHRSQAGIWIANAFQVLLITDGEIKKRFDFSDIGRFVTSITEDSKGNIWLTIPGSRHAYWIDQHFVLNKIEIQLGNEGVINSIRGGRDGIYIASAGKESYLFYKSFTDSAFRNISVPFKIKTTSDFNVTDLKINEQEIWLATSDGLMKFDHKSISRISLGNNYTNLPVKSIQMHPDNKILLANAFGLILFDPETLQVDNFNESSGMLSNTITPRGLFVDNTETIWVGTAKGLCYSTSALTQLKNTPTPKFTEILANGKKVGTGNNEDIPYGSFLSVQVSCITFPNDVNLQYRLLPDPSWKFTSDYALTFADLSAGDHTLEVKAKKNGPYVWSEAAQLQITIGTPFWHRWWFYLLLMMGLVMLISATTIGVNIFNKRRNLVLQKLVDKRTNQLRIRNEELIKLNQEKNNLIGIVSHDLRNPLGQISSLISLIKSNSSLNKETSMFLDLMDQTVSRLTQLIIKILDVDAIESRQMNLTIESLNVTEVFNNVASHHLSDAAAKNITIEKNIPEGVYGLADRNYLEQVLENLLSNAIKFSPKNLNIYLSIQVIGDKVRLIVKDEGPGISEADKKKLFGKYQKLSARPTGGESSTGLGLSITKRFVQAMHGEIWCESEVGNGAAFIVEIPNGNV